MVYNSVAKIDRMGKKAQNEPDDKMSFLWKKIPKQRGPTLVRDSCTQRPSYVTPKVDTERSED